MKLGLVQFKADKGDKAGSLGRLVALTERAADGADLVVLPEMAATGYVFPDRSAVRAVSEPPDGPTWQALSPIAARSRAWIVAGFPEVAGDVLFNSALVIDPAGQLAFVYRKTLLYSADMHWASPGDSGYRSFDTDAGRFGVGICMDLNDDRFIEWVSGQNLDAVAFPTNWVQSEDKSWHTWDYWAWRMDGQRAALAAANTWGVDGGVTFTGQSAVLRDRTILAAGPLRGNGSVKVDLG